MTWSTFDELSFVRGLGGWRERNSAVLPARRLECLKLYRLSCPRRRVWGSINQHEVLGEVDRLIAELQEKKP